MTRNDIFVFQLLQMFESTGWVLVEPSNEDTNKYDNICPTVVSWTPPSGNKGDPGPGVSDSSDLDGAENSKVIYFLLKN